jgi:glycosyltransferase involved in cell wall biosynthesis
LSPPLDAEAIARNIASLLGDEELRQSMGRKGREKAERLYDWEGISLQYEGVLRDVVQKHRTRG